jgi:uncharacterized membrane protein
MKSYLWSARMTVISSLFLLYVPFILNLSVYQFENGHNLTSLVFVWIACIATYYYIKKSKQAIKGEYGDKFTGKQTDSAVMVTLLVISMGLASIYFILYAVMFMLSMNQIPPYPHKWNEIAHFCSLVFALLLSAVALWKVVRIKET